MSTTEERGSRPQAGTGITRRDLLRYSGRAGAGAAAAWLLAACGVGGRRESSSGENEVRKLPPLANELVIAQWPLYIDKKTIPNFEAATGIDVSYKEVINDNQEFFSVVAEPLSAGQRTGWDLMALSDWVVAKMNRNEWLEPLNHSLLTNVNTNIGPKFADPPYDPGNGHSVPWQGGITGIAYNTKLVDKEPRAFADLWDPAYAGHVGMLTEMVDTMNLTLLSLGMDPEDATVDDAAKAQARLQEQNDAGIVRSYYGNNYVAALSRGDLWVTMAWSGDVFWLSQDQPEMRFVVPEEGGLLWVTPLEMPKGAEHPRDAHAFLDYVYDPEVAADITSYVGYVTPVPEVKDVLLKRAAKAKSKGQADYLRGLAESPFVFPTADMDQSLHYYKVLTAEEETEWNRLFQQVTVG